MSITPNDAQQEMLTLLETKRADAEFLHDGIPTPQASLSDLFETGQDEAILTFLTTGQSVREPFSGQPLIVPGKPEESALYLHITDPRGRMFQRFDDQEISIIKRWIMALEPASSASAQVSLAVKRIASGLTRPLFVTSPPGDRERLFIVEKGMGSQPGRIKIFNLETESLNDTPFLEITDLRSEGERGLLGLAFHPNYAVNGQFFVNFTANDNAGTTIIRRYTVSDNTAVADSNSAKTILTIPQPFANHNGGWIAFGPNDGYLYIATGDGGSGDDPDNNAQNLGMLLGKMLRIDVNSDDFPNDDDHNYAIPADNPFVNQPGAQPEIWAYGLRNPWRCSFDRQTGDLYIADVGQLRREEINFQPASSAGGENYGWRLKEGTLPHIVGPANPPALIDPIHEYNRQDGRSIIGGYVYRGEAIPELQGTYFFADFHSSHVWSFRYDGTDISDFTELDGELTVEAGELRAIASFGEDEAGELYMVSLRGDLFKITAPLRTTTRVNVASLDAVGKIMSAPSADFPDVFLCRIRYEEELPEGAVEVGPDHPGECIVAFSRVCTHLACYLVEESDTELPLYEDGFVMCACKCHLSSFDLAKRGVPINAPATACLPQVRLLRQSADTTQPIKTVELSGWMDASSVPYGVPYGNTWATHNG